MYLTPEQQAFFEREGWVVLPGWYDLEREIYPILYGIWQILGLIINKYNLPITRQKFSPHTFDEGFQEIIVANRRYGAEVYDAVKQIPAFLRLVSTEKNSELFAQIRNTAAPGIAAAGYGIRIDNPNEDKFRSTWHYEYRDQLRSVDGIVFWTPLLPITPELGPVFICPGSHKSGLQRSYFDETTGRPGAYSLVLENEAEILRDYPPIAPLSNPGDLILMDFLTIHSSGFNTSHRSRWSIQFRLFNFDHESGIRIAWSGAVANGVSLQTIHPELIIEKP